MFLFLSCHLMGQILELQISMKAMKASLNHCETKDHAYCGDIN